MRRRVVIQAFQFFQCWNGEEIPVQKKQAVSKDFGDTESILHHLNNMGRAGNRCAIPIFGSLKTIMEANTQGDAGPTAAAACQYTKAAKHMAMDVFRLCGIFGFLKEFFNSRHPAPFLGLLDSVTNQNVKIPFLIEGRVLPDSRELALVYLMQGPGRSPEKVKHGKITVGAESQVTDD